MSPTNQVDPFDASPVRFGVRYDFRNPEPWSRPFEALYRESLDQIAWAETLGYRAVWLTEHHFADDGYTPSPLVIAAAIAERTQRMMIGTSLIQLPLHDPIRLAEDAASVAILSGGRFDLGVGIGYRALEFEAFGREVRHRPSLMEEGVELIRRSWAGESLAFEGKRHRVPDLRVTPVPARAPRLLIGAMNDVAIDRAARIGDGFLSNQPAHHDRYLAAVARHGRDPATVTIHSGQSAVVDADPERTWARIGKHVAYQANVYAEWGAFGPPETAPRFDDPDTLVTGGAVRLWDAATAAEELVRIVRAHPQVKDLYFWAQYPGESIESGSARMEFFMSEVAPRVVAELAKDGRPAADADRTEHV